MRKHFRPALMVSVLLSIRSVVGHNVGLNRSSGPDRIVQDTRMVPSADAFQTDGLLTCYLHCVNFDESCKAVSFEISSKTCTLSTDVGASFVSEIGWVSVNRFKQKNALWHDMCSGHKLKTFAIPGESSTSTAVLSTSFIECPDEFTGYLDKCYYVWNGTQQTWSNAKISCHELNAELLSIETKAEQLYIAKIILGLDFEAHLWTSGKGTGGSSFKWMSSNVDVIYANWDPNFPLNFDTDNCLYIDGKNLVWQYEKCVGINKFMCEYPKSTP